MPAPGERKLLDECKSNGSIRIVAGPSGEDQQDNRQKKARGANVATSPTMTSTHARKHSPARSAGRALTATPCVGGVAYNRGWRRGTAVGRLRIVHRGIARKRLCRRRAT